MSAQNPPVNGVAFIFYVKLPDFAIPGKDKVNPTLAAGDVLLRIDDAASTLGAGSSANLITLPVVTPAGSAWVKVSLSASEMTGDNIGVQFLDQTSPQEWSERSWNIQTTAAGGGSDPWATDLPGSYVAGQAGYIVGTDIPAISSDLAQVKDVTDSLVNTAGKLWVLDENGNALPHKDEVDAIKAITDQFVFTVANQVDANALTGGGGLDAAGVRGAIGMAAADLDDQLAGLPDLILDKANGVETGLTLRQALRLEVAALVGKLSGAGSNTISIRDINDTVNRIVATVDSFGDRTAVVTDVT